MAHAQAVGCVEGVGGGGEGDGVLLEDPEGEGDDGLCGFEGDGLAVTLGIVLGGDADVVGCPVDALDHGVAVEGAAGCGEPLREELGEAVVTVLDAEEAVAFGGLFGGLLEAEGAGGDDAVVGGVEAFDVADAARRWSSGMGWWVR